MKKPIETLKLLSKEDSMIIFSTIDPILEFHTQFCVRLEKEFENYHKYSMFGDIILKYVSFFQIYQEYILYAEQAEKKFL